MDSRDPLDRACAVVGLAIGVSDIGVATIGKKVTICDARGSCPSISYSEASFSPSSIDSLCL
jgi:hypothetical protein